MRLKIPAIPVLLAGLTAVSMGQFVAPHGQPGLVFIQNKHLRVGVHLQWGGAITHVSEPGGPNLINSSDLGRQIQQSYYAGPNNYQHAGKRKSPSWAGFPWNPIQSGDVFHNGSRVLEHRVRGGELYVKTVPMLWPMDNDPGECVMETWITLVPDAPRFTYRARLTNVRSDRTLYPQAMNQELPAVYVNGPWHHLMTYTGDRPFTGAAVTEIRNDHQEPWPWVHFLATEGWAALVNDAGTGLGVCVPAASEFHGGFFGQRGVGDEKSPNTGYMAPIACEMLDHNIVYEYTRTFVLGSIEQIRTAAGRVMSKELPSWSFACSRQGWHYQNGRDAGWPPTGQGLQVKAVDPAQPVRLVGPMTFWRSAAARGLDVQVSSAKAGQLKVFWRGLPPPEATARPSAWNDWQAGWWSPERSTAAAIPARRWHWVKVPLAGAPGYAGALSGLALDVPDGVTIHEVRLVK